MTSTRSSTSTTSSPATTSSSPPPASPTATCCRASATPGRQGDDRVAGDALALGHRAHGQRPPRPAEAARGHRRPLRLRAAGGRRGRRRSSPAPRATSAVCWRRQLAADGRRGPRAWRAIRAARRRPRARRLRDRRGRRARARDPGAGARGCRGRLLPRPLDGPRRPTATSPSATVAAAAQLRRGRAARPAVERLDLPRRARRAGLRAPAQPPRDRRGPGRRPGIPLTYFRAAAVIGAGSESFRVVSTWSSACRLMVTPSWVATRTQPIAIADVSPTCARRPESRRRRARDRDRRARGHHLRRDDGRMADALGRRPPLRIAGAAADPAALLALDRAGHPGRRRRRQAAGRGAGDRDRGHRPSRGWRSSTSTPTPLAEAMRAAVAEVRREARGWRARSNRPGASPRSSRGVVAGVVVLVAQSVDHRARQQREADQVEPDQGDQDEAERAADLLDVELVR